MSGPAMIKETAATVNELLQFATKVGPNGGWNLTIL